MDCKTARYLLDFARPQVSDLDAPDRAALGEHLAHCSECDALNRGERQLDEHLGRAVRAVPVPPGLKERLLARLKTQREQWWIEGLKRAGRWVAAAAVLVVAAGAVFWWKSQQLPSVDSDKLMNTMLTEYIYSPPDAEEAIKEFARKGHRVSLPREFNYEYLTAYGFTTLQGREVPYLRFVRSRANSNNAQFAEVLLLSDKKFDLSEVQPLQDPGGYRFKVEVRRGPAGEYAYVIVYTGNLADLLQGGSDL
jgi:hypothetical protein